MFKKLLVRFGSWVEPVDPSPAKTTAAWPRMSPARGIIGLPSSVAIRMLPAAAGACGVTCNYQAR